MTNLIETIQNKMELFRLEQRYTKRRNRRSTFVSEATYQDGEYIYANSPTTMQTTQSRRPGPPQHTGSSTSNSSTSSTNSNPFSLRSSKSQRFGLGFATKGSAARSGREDREPRLSPVDDLSEGAYVAKERGWGAFKVKVPGMSKRGSDFEVREVR